VFGENSCPWLTPDPGSRCRSKLSLQAMPLQQRLSLCPATEFQAPLLARQQLTFYPAALKP
jgi:hypothetical protein